MIMDKTLSLQAQTREQTGSKAAAAVRQQGRIPAIVYGHKQEPVAISLDAHDFVEGVHHGHRLMDITVAGQTDKMIIKDLQYDYLGRRIIHADLMRVDVTEMIEVTVPIEFKGTAKGTQEGGIVEAHLDRIEVECQVINIPESIVVSVKDLEVGQSIRAGDVKVPEGVKLVTPAETFVVSCRVLVEAKTTEQLEAETPVAPELIREREPKAEGEAAEQ
jgi:large subunit ribosomal protein L25